MGSTRCDVSMIVPRWEWRTFGDSFGEADARLAALQPTKVGDSDELYILASRVEGSIKIRDGKLDVKRLERRSEDGLQQWRPVANAEFPITATDLAALLAALDVSVPSLDREAYTLDQLIDEVVAPRDELLAVGVGEAPGPPHARRLPGGGDPGSLGITDNAYDCRRRRGPGARPFDGRKARTVVTAERQLPARADPTARPRLVAY